MERVEVTFPEIETNRLRLRKIEIEDAECILRYLSDSDVMEYYGLPPFNSIEQAKREIEWYDKIFQRQTGIRWGITLKGDNKVIGSCGFLNWLSDHHRVDIGYELDKKYWGMGIASEALRAVLAYGFESLDIQRVQALIEPPNLASIHLVEKHGFHREGLLRQYEYGNGKFDDLLMYSLLKSDFYQVSEE
ncbi:GNAT family N-acetyltransferase [Ornithinibacillus sp. 179-J 7C1 HS]|uniref:GNAT family N-acetyltransferase n=1 Tax=Ornithinibacillus sp. 179-J 7C1 HS TaxID=3142384 RepID=UPI00399F7876